MATLHDSRYFPPLHQLPLAEEFDSNYYMETPQGGMMPNRTWTFCGEITSDQLSQLPDFYHRVEVRDIVGGSTSVLFNKEQGSLDFRQLRTGHTLFLRYAHKVFFSDLMTEVLQADHLDFAKVIACDLDTLLCFSQFYYSPQSVCMACNSSLAGAGSQLRSCPTCGTGQYCSQQCMTAHAAAHASHCSVCQELNEVLNIDHERFLGDPIPFRMEPK